MQRNDTDLAGVEMKALYKIVLHKESALARERDLPGGVCVVRVALDDERLHDERGLKLLTGFIRKKMEDGKLRKAEPDLAAEHFMHLALGELSRRLLLGLVRPRKEQIEKRLNSAVDVFQRAYSS